MAFQQLRLLAAFAAWGAVMALSACGGGGGGGGAGDGASYFDPAAAQRNLMTQGGQWTVQGTASDGQLYRLELTAIPGAAAVYPVTGQLLPTLWQTTRIWRNGAVLAESGGTSYCDTASYVPHGGVDSEGICSYATLREVPPTVAFVGESGAISVSRRLVSCADRGFWNGRTDVDWSIDIENAMAMYCLRTTLLNASGATVLGRESDCFEIDARGALGPRLRVTLDVPSSAFSLVARNY
jgi:hypothetical protein